LLGSNLISLDPKTMVRAMGFAPTNTSKLSTGKGVFYFAILSFSAFFSEEAGTLEIKY
jgi:hypothetical protein